MKQIATDNYYNINSFTIEEGISDSLINITDCRVCVDLLENNGGFKFVVNKEKTRIKGFWETGNPVKFDKWTFDLFFYCDIRLSQEWNILLTRGLINVNMKTITFVVDGRDR